MLVNRVFAEKLMLTMMLSSSVLLPLYLLPGFDHAHPLNRDP